MYYVFVINNKLLASMGTKTLERVLQYIFPFKLPPGLSDPVVKKSFAEWDQPSRQIQISAMLFLTAWLYAIFSVIDKSWVPDDIESLMRKLHLWVVIPLLLAISYLAYKKSFYSLTMRCLAVYPLISMSCHAYIASQFEGSTPLLTEGYLGVLWIFIVSGMTFGYAIVSASVVSAILLVSGFYFIGERDAYLLHVFWIFCSFSFGIMGALIFDLSRKEIFWNQRKLQALAVTDPLTGIYNRNKFDQILSQEIKRDIRYDESFGLLIIDIDHFKNINDSFGHNVGDQVICKTAELLAQSIRENDTLVRWGGEEFVVIALGVNEESLDLLANKLRLTIERAYFPLVDNITVSVGATLFRKDDSQNALLARADRALYAAKEKGRNLSVTVSE